MPSNFKILIDVSNQDIGSSLDILQRSENEDFYGHFLTDIPEVCFYNLEKHEHLEQVVAKGCDHNDIPYTGPSSSDVKVNEIYWAMDKLAEVVVNAMTPIRDIIAQELWMRQSDGIDCIVYNGYEESLKNQGICTSGELPRYPANDEVQLVLNDIKQQPSNKLLLEFGIHSVVN